MRTWFVRAKVRQQEEARLLRQQGLSVRRIARMLGVSISSVSRWTRELGVQQAREAATDVIETTPAFDCRRCSCCGCARSTSDFNRGQWWCRECFKRYFADRGPRHSSQVKIAKERRIGAARGFLAEYLASHLCMDCGETEILVLEFDHCRGVKRHDISRLLSQGPSIARLKRELGVCDVVCANCHRRRTARRGSWFRAGGPVPATWTSSRERNYRRLLAVLRERGCRDCGEQDVIDHVGAKDGAVTKLAASCSLERLEAEMRKCEIRCCNCHRLATFARRGATWRGNADWASLAPAAPVA
jgi:hypothetical protein